jgi:hypothetical protein
MAPDGKWVLGLIWPANEREGWVQHPTTPLPIVRIPFVGGAPETILQVQRPSPISCSRPPASICVIAELSDNRKQMIVSRLDSATGRGPEFERFDLDREIEWEDELLCAISADGTRLAIARSPESPIEIHSLHGQLMHSIPSRTKDTKLWLTWTADQKGFFVTRRTPDGNELIHLDLQGKESKLWSCFGWGCFPFPSPDGRHLATFETKSSTNMWMMENF